MCDLIEYAALIRARELAAAGYKRLFRDPVARDAAIGRFVRARLCGASLLFRFSSARRYPPVQSNPERSEAWRRKYEAVTEERRIAPVPLIAPHNAIRTTHPTSSRRSTDV